VCDWGVGCLFSMVAFIAYAGVNPLPGDYFGEGRTCYGDLHISAQAIEWTSNYSTCGPTGYEILNAGADIPSGMAYRLNQRQANCRYAVIELEPTQSDMWTVRGYRSLTAWKNRALPGWKDSIEPGRMPLECGMLRSSQAATQK
jgi:hypothetical protein